MGTKYHFIISRYCPKEEIFDGEMDFTEARKFMDEHATEERRVGFKVFNELKNRWEDCGDSFHGGRKVYDKQGSLFFLDPDYSSMWKPDAQRFHLWRKVPDGSSRFVQSFATEEQAVKWRDFLQQGQSTYEFYVKPSDVKED